MNFIEKYSSTLFIVYVAILFSLLIAPLNGIKLNQNIFYFSIDKFIHSFIFIPFFIGLRYYKPNFKIGKSIVISYFSGISLELLHLFIPYRTFSFGDIFANVIGITLSIGIYYSLKKLLSLK